MSKKSQRDDFLASTIRLLHDKVNGLCSNPDCRILTRGPNSKADKITSIGQAAHITAAAKGGPRYNASLTKEQRKSYENGIWLCNNHARIIDSDEENYSPELLKNWKLDTEKYVKDIIGKPLIFKKEEDIFERLREVSLTLLEVGCANWKMPKFVAPLNLESRADAKKETRRPTNISKLVESINSGENLLIFGDGGIGKTTCLLELSEVMLKTESSRIPFYIDAAEWAAGSDSDIFEFIADNPSAKRDGVSAREILRAADTGRLTLAINGWNEIPGPRKLACLKDLRRFATSIPNLNFILTIRSVGDSPNIGFKEEVQVLGLSWNTQAEIIRNALNKDASDKLIEFLAQNTRLRHASRSPLIIQGLISHSRNNNIEASSVFDLLGAVVRDFEEDDQRQPQLQEKPLQRQQSQLLESLAFNQSSHQKANSPRQEVLPVISKMTRQLTEDGYYNIPPDPNETLDALCTYHLLHSDRSTIRFIHQRFQEYFTARAILKALENDSESNVAILIEAINHPFFEDALRLVCDKIRRAASYKEARALLVKTALGIDLSFACELAGYCSFVEVDDAALFQEMVSQIEGLCDPHLPKKVVQYGLGCLIASRFRALSSRLWPLLEHDDQQKRLNTHRLLKRGITVEQLGNRADERIQNWSLDRKVELINELSRNAENYSFIVKQANEAIDNKVRAAAISELAWSFPASEATLKAWLNAPMPVQLANKVLSAIQYTIKQGDGSDELYDAIRALFYSHTGDVKHRIAHCFPQIIGLDAIEIVLKGLWETKGGNDQRSLISLAETHAPEKLQKLAVKLILSGWATPDWAYEIVYQLPEDAQSEIFESAWAMLRGESPGNLRMSEVGPLASRDQILLCVSELLSSYRNRQQSELEREKIAEVRRLFWSFSGEKLLSAILELGPEASHRDSVEMLDLLNTCITLASDKKQNQNPWLPTNQSVAQLIAIYRDKSGDNDIWQNEILDNLCSIASRVDPIEFSSLILDAFHKHHDDSLEHEKAVSEWMKNRSKPQPNTRIIGTFVASAERGGFDILPSLFDLLDQGIADDLVPSAISKIVSAPWLEKRDRFVPNVTHDFIDGEERRLKGRVLQQPSDDLQDLTNTAAKKLCAKLTRLVNKLEAEWKDTAPDGNEKQAQFHIKPILSAVAHIPSPIIFEPLMLALGSGFVDLYGIVDTWRSLIRQGKCITEITVIQNLEKMYMDKIQAEWLHNHEHYLMWETCQIMWAVEPSSLLNKPLIEYMQECKSHYRQSEIIRFVGNLPHDSSWDFLIEMSRQLYAKGNIPRELLHSVMKSLKTQNFEQFIDLIKDGRWFSWFQNPWDLKEAAPAVLQVIGENQVRLKMFLDACEQSDAPSSNGFACALLNSLPNGDSACINYGLRILDTGGVDDIDDPVCSMLTSLFMQSVLLTDNGSYSTSEVYPKSCNSLRLELFKRSKEEGNIAETSRQLLAEVECWRRESSRPSDEPRHPELGDMGAWNSVLVRNTLLRSSYE